MIAHVILLHRFDRALNPGLEAGGHLLHEAFGDGTDLKNESRTGLSLMNQGR